MDREREGSLLKPLGIFWALIRFYFRLIPSDWYRRSPFLPIPPRSYVRWRMRTAYGKQPPVWRDVIRDLWQFGGWLRSFK